MRRLRVQLTVLLGLLGLLVAAWGRPCSSGPATRPGPAPPSGPPSTVSHELLTPLTLIHGFAELLVLRDMPAEPQRSSAVEILDASRRQARLIDDLLSVSRMESGRLVLLRTKLPTSLPVVWGDPDKVEQILTNLVGNAIKYSPGGGEVLVTVGHDGDTVQVSVRDQESG